MEPREDDEMELINAEFNSLVAGLNLDQSSPRTYLDELAEIEAAEKQEIYQLPALRRGVRGSISHIAETLRRWWRGSDTDGHDGAVL